MKKNQPQFGHHSVFTVALTGGIASGKTLISNSFKALGVPVIDTDIIARQIVEPGQPALQEIKDSFGPGFIDDHGRLKRAGMRDLIFSDSAARNKLESILHPIIRQRVTSEILKVVSDYCILVIPLLTEGGGYPDVDRVLLVDVDRETQISRLMSRDNSTRQQAEKAVQSQASRAQRIKIADDILLNDGSLQQVQTEVSRLHRKYKQLAHKLHQ